jgi:cysteine-rich repeat protein
MSKNTNKIIFSKSVIFLLFIAPFFILNIASAQTKTSPDAIAIRIIPNPSHFSAALWYEKNNFKGSPQSLTVDGYEGVRDGRTVYVNVGNIDVSNNLYTNIYLISYNQSAEQGTVDIFGNILRYWRFNSNVVSAGKCRGDAEISCFMDDECAIQDFCTSQKARIIRDVKRLSDFARLSEILKNFSSALVYPTLNSGSYLANRTLSVWPSWKDTLAKELKISLPVDPINKIGTCPSDFNQDTCWNEKTKKFSENWPELPSGSLSYMYTGQADGANFGLCAVRETGYAITGKNYFGASCPEFCLDYDGDGYGSPGSGACSFPQTDCDDTNKLVSLGTPEAGNCSDGFDNDCDGLADCDDPDCFGFVGCGAPPVCGNGTCEPTENCLGCWADCRTWGNSICDESCGECPLGAHQNLAECACGNGTLNCGEQCDDGNLTNGDGCNSTCNLESYACTDNDGDYFISEGTVVASCNSLPIPPCGPGKNEMCIGNNDCNDSNVNVFPGNAEICDGIDNNCVNGIDEGWTEENCGYKCGFNYNSSRLGNLRCCGDDAGEGGPYQNNEKTPVDLCADSGDNDCDGKVDILDEECMPCLPTTFINEKAWYVLGQPDCDQCNLEGSQDSDQDFENWSAYPGKSDQCDSDCGTVSATVRIGDYQSVETRCDGIDNDCNGAVDDGLGQTTCGLGPCNHTINNCVGGVAQTCNPLQGAIAEICGNNIDEDCNGSDLVCGPVCTDADGDRYIAENTNASLCGNVCGPSKNMACLGNNDCDDVNAYEHPSGVETCDNNDNDCSDTNHSDGVNPSDIDNGCDDDGDNYCDSGMIVYNAPVGVCNLSLLPNGSAGNDCNDAVPGAAIHPGAAELCDGINNDCNPLTFFNPDEAFYEGVNETLCGDTHDNDCDGLVDVADTVDCPSAIGCTFPFTFPCTF